MADTYAKKSLKILIKHRSFFFFLLASANQTCLGYLHVIQQQQNIYGNDNDDDGSCSIISKLNTKQQIISHQPITLIFTSRESPQILKQIRLFVYLFVFHCVRFFFCLQFNWIDNRLIVWKTNELIFFLFVYLEKKNKLPKIIRVTLKKKNIFDLNRICGNDTEQQHRNIYLLFIVLLDICSQCYVMFFFFF